MFKATAYFYGFANHDNIVYIIIVRALYMNPLLTGKIMKQLETNITWFLLTFA